MPETPNADYGRLTLLGAWLLLFGMWPLADPGHSDFASPLVWLDLALHGAGAVLLFREIERRAQARAVSVLASAASPSTSSERTPMPETPNAEFVRSFKPGDRVYVTDPGLAQLRKIMAEATGSAPDNHRGVVDEVEGDTVFINFDDGGCAPYPVDEVRHG